MKNLLVTIMIFAFLVSCNKKIETITTQITVSDKDSTLPMDLAFWQYFSEKERTFKMPETGRYEKTAEGLKVYASDFRYGARLSTNSEFFVNGKSVYIKWKFNAGGDFADYKASLYYDKYSEGSHSAQKVDFAYLTTKTVYNSSTLVKDDTWYYTRISFSNGIVVSNTADKSYDNSGGNVIQTRTTSVPLHSGFLSVRGYDTYTGVNSFFILGECKIKNN